MVKREAEIPLLLRLVLFIFNTFKLGYMPPKEARLEKVILSKFWHSGICNCWRFGNLSKMILKVEKVTLVLVNCKTIKEVKHPSRFLN